MTREGAAGRGPSAKRATPSRTQRSRVASPTRSTPNEPDDQSPKQTTVTARAAVLVVVLASVMLAVALPFKIWLGQRGDMASLVAQTRQTELHLAKLNAQDKRWQNPAYVEAQARKRLHYTMPGVTTHVVLGRSTHSAQAGASHAQSVATGPWYSEFWQSLNAAGKTSPTGAATGSAAKSK